MLILHVLLICKYMNDLLFNNDFFIIYTFVHFFFYYTKCLVQTSQSVSESVCVGVCV